MLNLTLVTLYSSTAQEITLSDENKEKTEEPKADAKENLDLELVATIFGESDDLEDFEQKLNDPKNNVSNLDLNNDLEVDYLRVYEKSDGNKRIVIVQSAISEDLFKDVASIVVVKDDKNNVDVKLIGEQSLYGVNYSIVPAYRAVPKVIVWFWSPTYKVWVSPYRYGFYPTFFKPRAVVKRNSFTRATRNKARVRTKPRRRRTKARVVRHR